MKLVIWDIDGTLVDSHAVIMASMDAGMAAAGLPPLPHAQVSTIVGLSLPIAIATLLPGTSEAARDTVAEGYRTHYMTTRSAGESALFPGALATLTRLAARDDTLMAVATGKSRRGLNALLDEHDLARFFATTECADGNPSKPAPGMILACLRDTGIAADRAVMIGDTSFDMDMARNAGTQALAVAWGHHPAARLTDAGARAVARDFPDLDRMIDEFLT